MRRIGALVILIMLCVGTPLLLVSFGGGQNNNDVQASGFDGGLNPASETALAVYYWDSYRRPGNMVRSNLRLRQTGLIPIAGGWIGIDQPINANYGGFGGVVGTTGYFELGLVGVQQPGGSPGLLTVEFAPPKQENETDFSFTTRSTITQTEVVGGITTVRFSINYNQIGVYRVTVRTTSNAGATNHENIYWIFIRNRVWGDPSFNPWTITTRLGQHSDIVVNNPSNRTNWTLTIHQTLTNLPSTNVRFAGIGQGIPNPTDNLSVTNRAGVEVLHNPNPDLNLFRATWAGGTQPIQIHIRTEANKEGRQVPIEIPNDTFTIRSRVLVNMSSMDINGFATTPTIPDLMLESRIQFREPAARRGFPWLTLVISIAVLLVLGGTIIGTNWLIRNSQNNHALKLSRKARKNAEIEQQNFDQLRSNLNEEYQDEKVRVDLYRQAQEIMEMLEQEEGPL